jgi:hypothetical protein
VTLPLFKFFFRNLENVGHLFSKKSFVDIFVPLLIDQKWKKIATIKNTANLEVSRYFANFNIKIYLWIILRMDILSRCTG